MSNDARAQAIAAWKIKFEAINAATRCDEEPCIGRVATECEKLKLRRTMNATLARHLELRLQ